MNGATLLLGLAAVLDVIANALLKKSDGFKRWVPGVLALVLVGTGVTQTLAASATATRSS